METVKNTGGKSVAGSRWCHHWERSHGHVPILVSARGLTFNFLGYCLPQSVLYCQMVRTAIIKKRKLFFSFSLEVKILGRLRERRLEQTFSSRSIGNWWTGLKFAQCVLTMAAYGVFKIKVSTCNRWRFRWTRPPCLLYPMHGKWLLNVARHW